MYKRNLDIIGVGIIFVLIKFSNSVKVRLHRLRIGNGMFLVLFSSIVHLMLIAYLKYRPRNNFSDGNKMKLDDVIIEK